MNKTPTNTAALNVLKNQGWKVNVTHYRRLNDEAYFPYEYEIGKGRVVKDSVYRQSIQGFSDKSDFWREEISHFGGATEMILERGEEKITVRADCYVKDRFNRKLGVAACLKKLENLYGIK